MRKLFMGCAVAGLIVVSPKSGARPPAPKLFTESLRCVVRSPWVEIGKASWYGSERQGKPTASGELFDKDKLTAAHRILPLGAKVRVTNLQNLSSVMLRINDRGPGYSKRVIDVSMAAAKQLGFVKAGMARVAVEVVSFPIRCIRHGTDSPSPSLN